MIAEEMADSGVSNSWPSLFRFKPGVWAVMESGDEKSAAPGLKSGGIRAILRKIGLGLALIIFLLGIRQLYKESPLWTVSLIGLTVFILGICLLAIEISAVRGFFWDRGHYKTAEFFLKRMTVNLDKDVDAQTKLGDLYFHGLGRKKDWSKAAAYYGRVLILDTEAKKALLDAFGSIMAEDAVIDWTEPACLPNLQKIAKSGEAEAGRFLDSWSKDDPFKSRNFRTRS